MYALLDLKRKNGDFCSSNEPVDLDQLWAAEDCWQKLCQDLLDKYNQNDGNLSRLTSSHRRKTSPGASPTMLPLEDLENDIFQTLVDALLEKTLKSRNYLEKLGDAPILAFLSRGTQLFARYLLLQSKPPEHSQSVADASAPTDRSLMNLALRSQRLLELEQKVAIGGRILASVITLDILEERGVKELEAGTMLRAVARRSSVGF